MSRHMHLFLLVVFLPSFVPSFFLRTYASLPWFPSAIFVPVLPCCLSFLVPCFLSFLVFYSPFLPKFLPFCVPSPLVCRVSRISLTLPCVRARCARVCVRGCASHGGAVPRVRFDMLHRRVCVVYAQAMRGHLTDNLNSNTSVCVVYAQAMEGTRLTVVLHEPEGVEFTIRTPGTPARWAQ